MLANPVHPSSGKAPLRKGLPGLARGQLHEIHAQGDDWATALAFALASVGGSRPVLLGRSPRRRGMCLGLCGEGLAAQCLDPARLVIVEARDGLGLLRAGLEAARCPGLSAVVLETWGRLPEYDLTASRRLLLAAERSRVPVVVLRGDAASRPSAASTRWAIRSAPSIPLAARAPGPPAIEVELLRRRGGPAGLCWRLEWDEENGVFRESPGADVAPVPGAVAPLAGLRAGEAGAIAA